jgi:hypothetical protein
LEAEMGRDSTPAMEGVNGGIRLKKGHERWIERRGILSGVGVAASEAMKEVEHGETVVHGVPAAHAH